jgi:hypothetical protein
MTFPKLLAASLFGALLALPSAHADFRPGFGPGPGPGFGPGPGPGWGPGHGPGDWHDGHGPGGPGWGPGGPGGWHDGHGPGWGPGGPGPGPDWRDHCRWDPRDCGWGPRGPGFPPPPPPPPVQPLPPPPSFAGNCAGNFNGTFADGRQVFISVNGAGQYVTATIVEVQPQQENLVAQGVCTSVNGVSQLTLTVQNGVVEAGQIYEASDGRFYFDGTENTTNSRFILQRQ